VQCNLGVDSFFSFACWVLTISVRAAFYCLHGNVSGLERRGGGLWMEEVPACWELATANWPAALPRRRTQARCRQSRGRKNTEQKKGKWDQKVLFFRSGKILDTVVVGLLFLFPIVYF
jgi:hypothetical protein